ncbi:hypothetical protein [Ligilactobacillus sp. 110_WCHN]|uniref:hypothetical protein n=1 Tax=Ligilactobacillus sp. 110_WCHN TaxID=3057125 RepID=UPI0026729DFD|nr:hypothetical protein [Ligilactobacillus sp. 110_WCHN]MDO3392945.1 hypothetical protein [Ligilactobacillus sp. 110_WCHN]
MLVDMEKIYKEFQSFDSKDWEAVDKAMSDIIARREAAERESVDFDFKILSPKTDRFKKFNDLAKKKISETISGSCINSENIPNNLEISYPNYKKGDGINWNYKIIE